MKPGKNNEFYFLVEWERRSDGTKPENSHVSNEEFKTYAPRFLFEFYESKLVIFSRKKPSNREANSNGQIDPLLQLPQSPVEKPNFSDENQHQEQNLNMKSPFKEVEISPNKTSAVENEEDTENKNIFGMTVDTNKFKNRDNGQMFEEMTRELEGMDDSQFLNSNHSDA